MLSKKRKLKLKIKKLINDKNKKLKEFKKNEKINYREQIYKNRAKENLKKLKMKCNNLIK